MFVKIIYPANWLANSEIKNNPNVISKKVSKTDAKWFDLMEKLPSRSQKKTQVSQLEEDSEAGSGPATQAYREETLIPKPHQLIEMQVPLLEDFKRACRTKFERMRTIRMI